MTGKIIWGLIFNMRLTSQHLYNQLIVDLLLWKVVLVGILSSQFYIFILNAIGHINAPKDKTSAPCLHLLGPQRLEDFGKLLGLVVCVCIRWAALVGIKFFVIEILDGLDGCLHHAYLLTGGGWVAAGGTVGRSGCNDRSLTMSTVRNNANDASE